MPPAARTPSSLVAMASRITPGAIMAIPIESPSVTARQSLLMAIAASLATSAIQSTILLVRHFARHELIGFPREFVWWSLLAYLPFFVGLWLLASAGGWASRQLRRIELHGMAYTAFGVACLGVLFPTVAHVAQVILALGVGVVLGTALASVARNAAGAGVLLRTVGALALLQVAGGAAVWYRLEEERRAFASAPIPDPGPGRPNVVVLILDTVRAISLGAYGHDQPTSPRIDGIAAQGVRFESAFSTAPWTLPSHASLFTGRLPHELDLDYTRPLTGQAAMLARVFREHGWATGASVGNMYYTGWETGLGVGFESYRDYRRTTKQVLLHALVLQTEWARGIVRAAGRRSPRDLLAAVVSFRWYNDHRFPQFHRKWGDAVNRDLVDWLDTVGDRPFFAFANYFDAHIPYAPPSADRYRFDRDGRRRPVDLYHGAIRHLDGEVGALIDELERRGKLDNTVLVITSDHGEQFGEHGLWEHGNSTYAPAIQIPLIIRLPRQEGAGRVVRGAVSLADLARTLTELAGLPSHAFGGTSLAPVLLGHQDRRGGEVVAEYAYDRRKQHEHSWRWRSLMDDSLAYVDSGKWKPELFRLEDRKQVNDLAAQPGGAEQVRAYAARLDRRSPVEEPPP